MKRTIIISVIAIAVACTACSRNYDTDLVGTWDAGKATLDKNMTVVINGDDTLTAEIKELGMKPINGSYHLDNNKILFKFSTIELSYRIVKLDRKVLVMKNKYARITWNRIK